MLDAITVNRVKLASRLPAQIAPIRTISASRASRVSRVIEPIRLRHSETNTTTTFLGEPTLLNCSSLARVSESYDVHELAWTPTTYLSSPETILLRPALLSFSILLFISAFPTFFVLYQSGVRDDFGKNCQLYILKVIVQFWCLPATREHLFRPPHQFQVVFSCSKTKNQRRKHKRFVLVT